MFGLWVPVNFDTVTQIILTIARKILILYIKTGVEQAYFSTELSLVITYLEYFHSFFSCFMIYILHRIGLVLICHFSFIFIMVWYGWVWFSYAMIHRFMFQNGSYFHGSFMFQSGLVWFSPAILVSCSRMI